MAIGDLQLLPHPLSLKPQLVAKPLRFHRRLAATGEVPVEMQPKPASVDPFATASNESASLPLLRWQPLQVSALVTAAKAG